MSMKLPDLHLICHQLASHPTELNDLLVCIIAKLVDPKVSMFTLRSSKPERHRDAADIKALQEWHAQDQLGTCAFCGAKVICHLKTPAMYSELGYQSVDWAQHTENRQRSAREHLAIHHLDLAPSIAYIRAGLWTFSKWQGLINLLPYQVHHTVLSAIARGKPKSKLTTITGLLTQKLRALGRPFTFKESRELYRASAIELGKWPATRTTLPGTQNWTPPNAEPFLSREEWEASLDDDEVAARALTYQGSLSEDDRAIYNLANDDPHEREKLWEKSLPAKVKRARNLYYSATKQYSLWVMKPDR